mgnify:CR=1 FL=1
MKDNIPCIITVAITGSVPKKIDNPTVPTTVSEQIESTRNSYDAGASLVHLHVRNEDESPSSPDQINLADVTDYSPVSVQLGYGLIEMVDEDTGGPLINRITGKERNGETSSSCSTSMRI